MTSNDWKVEEKQYKCDKTLSPCYLMNLKYPSAWNITSFIMDYSYKALNTRFHIIHNSTFQILSKRTHHTWWALWPEVQMVSWVSRMDKRCSQRSMMMIKITIWIYFGDMVYYTDNICTRYHEISGNTNP